ncbi:hypothetical protein O6H91_16G008700 [Diphasiastrum complanatum]|uniref:Uncharacterized protein n=1 Tax=Diphasiastrum complanatum TaxID=34168 RepID=A0ACC2B9P9_DIPCM|nr:hypothetical protein O6H91_16G008700 [Diphasiastrum complanatum]
MVNWINYQIHSRVGQHIWVVFDHMWSHVLQTINSQSNLYEVAAVFALKVHYKAVTSFGRIGVTNIFTGHICYTAVGNGYGLYLIVSYITPGRLSRNLQFSINRL